MAKDINQDEEFSVDAQQLRAELDRIHQKKQSSGEASSALGQYRKQVAESIGCHKDALAIIEKIDAMSDVKLSDFMRTFRVLYEVMAEQWDDRVSDMLDALDKQSSDMENDLG